MSFGTTVTVNDKAMTYENPREATRQAVIWVRQSLERAQHGRVFRIVFMGRRVTVSRFASGALDVVVVDPQGRASLPSSSTVRAWYDDEEASWHDLVMPAPMPRQRAR